MWHILGEISIRLRQQFAAIALAYDNSQPRFKNFTWLTIGGLAGYIFALHNTERLQIPWVASRRNASEPRGKKLSVTKYAVNDAQVKLFENCWNQMARATQKSDGYFYTQLYKSMPQSTQNFSYLQLVLWKNQDSYKNWVGSEAAMKLQKKLQENCLSAKNIMYSTVFDDSVVRVIPV